MTEYRMGDQHLSAFERAVRHVNEQGPIVTTVDGPGFVWQVVERLYEGGYINDPQRPLAVVAPTTQEPTSHDWSAAPGRIMEADETMPWDEFARGTTAVLRAMAASDDVANSQSGTLWRFVHKFARQFGVELRASAAELELVTEPEPEPERHYFGDGLNSVEANSELPHGYISNPREDPNWLNDEIARHAEKQGVSWADAWRYFEKLGYKMESADPQYG